MLYLARLADAVRSRNGLLLVLRVWVRVIDDLQQSQRMGTFYMRLVM